MIHPNMATMLAFIFTDYNFQIKTIESKFQEIVDDTFNISVDGETSTSDMVLFSVKIKILRKKKKDLTFNF